MKNLVHESKYFHVWAHDDKALVEYLFNASTAFMKPQEYIDELKVFIEVVRKHKPKAVIGDMKEFAFPITPDIQEWVDKNLFTVYGEIDFKKIAILFSEEMIAQLSIEQTMEESSVATFQTAFYSTYEEAAEWVSDVI
jgi:hypothetical protein